MLPRHQLMLAVVPVSNLASQTSQPLVRETTEDGGRRAEGGVGSASTVLAVPASLGMGSRVAAAAMKSESRGAGLRAAAISSAACDNVGLLYSPVERGINLIFAAAVAPSRSATCAT